MELIFEGNWGAQLHSSETGIVAVVFIRKQLHSVCKCLSRHWLKWPVAPGGQTLWLPQRPLCCSKLTFPKSGVHHRTCWDQCCCPVLSFLRWISRKVQGSQEGWAAVPSYHINYQYSAQQHLPMSTSAFSWCLRWCWYWGFITVGWVGNNKNPLKETWKLNLWNNNQGCLLGISKSIWKKSPSTMHSELGTHSQKSIWVLFITLVFWGMALVSKFTLFVLNAVQGVKNPVEVLETHNWAKH